MQRRLRGVGGFTPRVSVRIALASRSWSCKFKPLQRSTKCSTAPRSAPPSSPSPSRSPPSAGSPRPRPVQFRKAADKAETQVSIKGDNGDYYGYVKSSDADNCANGRTVKVFKQTGSSQDPKNDQKIGTDIAQPNGTKYMWAIGNSGYKSGKFYAKVGKTDLCKGATSKTITR